MNTRSRIALVTGVSGGIGGEVALSHARQGCRVVGTYYSDQSAAERIVEQSSGLAGSIEVFSVDVTDQDSVANLFRSLAAQERVPEIVVCNSGGTEIALSPVLSDETLRHDLELNLVGAFRVARASLRPMIKSRWGRIVFVSSVAAFTGSSGQAAYAASKAGLVGLARSMTREVASRGITVNVIAPGPIDTRMMDGIPAARMKFLSETIPAGRVGTVAEVAAGVEALTAEGAGFINGAVLAVDGGLGMGH